MKAGARTLAAIGVGSNVGERGTHLEYAFGGIAALARTRLVARSSIMESEPLTISGAGGQTGAEAGGLYLNAAALIETELPARELLDGLLEIERQRGRVRVPGRRWGARTLDLDILLYGDLVVSEAGLVIPHPHLHERLFVLRPLAEVAPAMWVPTMSATVEELLRRVDRGATA
jgi:2-amino-4-hydroxy-6-hydroxymethyldihydropteridine diphosphokinase